MRYPMPNHPCDFEIPDDWLAEAGMGGSTTSVTPTSVTPAFRSALGARLVLLREVEPPYRSVDVPKDWCGFERPRLVNILKGIVAGAEIPPVPLLVIPSDLPSRAPYRFRVLNGFHRFYASIVAGFTHLPAKLIT